MKWVEAEALANIRDVDVKKFFWKNIFTRFGIMGYSSIARPSVNIAVISESRTDIQLEHTLRVMDK